MFLHHSNKSSSKSAESVARASKPSHPKGSSDLFTSDPTFPGSEAGRVVRVLLLSLVDQLGTHSQQLKDPKATEALHDTRVALRRLRSSVKIYGQVLDPEISDLINERLKTLAAQTGTARDAEVQLAWLAKRKESLPSNRRVALNAFTRELKSSCSTDYALLRSTWLTSLEEAAGQLIQLLSAPSNQTSAKSRAEFRKVFSDLSERYSRRLIKALDKVSSLDDTEELHEARIRAKYLRYLMAPFSPVEPRIERACCDLKRLQEVLGKLRDVQLLRQNLTNAPAELKDKSGFEELVVLVARDELKLFKQFERDWDGKGRKKFSKTLRLLAKSPFKEFETA